MADTLQLIDQLIEEHKMIAEKTRSIENAVNDSRLIADITQARDTFVPGKFDQVQKLKELEEMLKAIEIWLEKHFSREETILLHAVEEFGDTELVTALNKLLFEHSDLRHRLVHSKKRVAELLGGSLSRTIWDTTAIDTGTYLGHTRTLLGTHAGAEDQLFSKLRKKIKKSI
jgi:hemerythrin-like domain-containing protein